MVKRKIPLDFQKLVCYIKPSETKKPKFLNQAEDMEQDPTWGTFDANLTYDYLGKARDLINERYGTAEELLSIPELVVRIL